jgi:Lon protease-like protein
MNEESQDLADDEGIVRLFPLPNLVLFPHVLQPLHVFEPRYRQLMTDSLADDRQFALALLRPGWEADYHEQPPIFPSVCLGRIHDEEKLAGGRYNLVLRGYRRATVLAELATDRLYRVARVRWLDDVPLADESLRPELLARLEQGLLAWTNDAAAVAQLLQSQLSVGAICDVLAFALPLPLETKEELLGQPGVEARLRRLLEYLELHQQRRERRFPPDFSVN